MTLLTLAESGGVLHVIRWLQEMELWQQVKKESQRQSELAAQVAARIARVWACVAWALFALCLRLKHCSASGVAFFLHGPNQGGLV